MVNPLATMTVSEDNAGDDAAIVVDPEQQRLLLPCKWPNQIIHLRDNYNPLGLRFDYVDRFEGCDCEEPCRMHTCPNGILGVFCAPNCCPHYGECGNGLRDLPSMRLVCRDGTNEYALQATKKIDKGVVLGQYLGELKLESRLDESRVRNSGYRLRMKQRALQHSRSTVCIDARSYGSMMRFLNHSCAPSALFHQVGNGNQTTVVAVTRRTVEVGEELTVDYGASLWFICRCGEPTCCHRDLQGFFYQQ